MKKLIFAALISSFAVVPAVAQAAVAKITVSQPLFDASGKRLGSVYKVTADGSAQLIIEDTLVTVPASTLSEVNGKLTTSLTRQQIVTSQAIVGNR